MSVKINTLKIDSAKIAETIDPAIFRIPDENQKHNTCMK